MNCYGRTFIIIPFAYRTLAIENRVWWRRHCRCHRHPIVLPVFVVFMVQLQRQPNTHSHAHTPHTANIQRGKRTRWKKANKKKMFFCQRTGFFYWNANTMWIEKVKRCPFFYSLSLSPSFSVLSSVSHTDHFIRTHITSHKCAARALYARHICDV